MEYTTACTSIDIKKIDVKKYENPDLKNKQFDWLPPRSFKVLDNSHIGDARVNNCPVDSSLIHYYLGKCYQRASMYSRDPRTQIASVILVPREISKLRARIINKIRSIIQNYDYKNSFNEGVYEFCPEKYFDTKYEQFYGVNHWMGLSSDYKKLIHTPNKYFYMEHAERAAIANAQQSYTSKDLSTKGSIMIGTCLACADCGRAIIHSGITKVICHAPTMNIMKKNEHWKDSISAAFQMFKDHGVQVWLYNNRINRAPLIMMNGEVFNPAVLMETPQESNT